MAEKAPEQDIQTDSDGPPEFSEKDKSRARQWFKKAEGLRERRDYDYAIECYISGLEFWPEAVEEGHMPLWSLAIQRQQAGGKKPGMGEKLKKPTSGKDARQALRNAEHLLAKDPTNGGYLDAVLKNAYKADLPETLKWIAPKAFDSIRKEKKTNHGRFKIFRQAMVEAAERAGERGNPQYSAWCFELAVNAVEYLIGRSPTDMTLKDDQRDLSGRLTIARGKYGDSGSFRDSLQDGDKQKLLHDGERAKQGDQTMEALIAAARAEYEAEPTVPGKINAYVHALLKPERKKEELLAIEVLMKAHQELVNYSFKSAADDIRLRQLRRQTRHWHQRAQETGADDDKQQHRLAVMEESQAELDIFRERVDKYPTDLRLKYQLGKALVAVGEYDEAIPLLQEAQSDPRSRQRCRLMIGRSFFEKGAFAQAAEVLSEALEQSDAKDDDLAKNMLYWVARSFEGGGKVDEARAAFGKLLRMDYNYADGDARTRHENLKEL